MKYADIKCADIANGNGVRVSLFVSGCTHRCKGCFNEIAWDFNYGNEFDQNAKDKIYEELNKDYVEGLSLLGGEPLEDINVDALLPFVKEVKEKYPNKNIWCYTGYTLDKLMEQKPKVNELMDYIDVVVDGEFIQENYKPGLKFKGSTNQRIIDVKKTKENHCIKLVDFS